MSTQPTSRPLALITGASAGIGTAFAERLARDQYDLILVARRKERLDDLAKRLHQSQHVNVEVMAADLTKPDELRAVEKRAEDAALELLINNAGFGGYMPFVSLDPDRAEELIRLQVIAVTRVTRAALPGMVSRGRGAIINVSSRLAFSGTLPSPLLPKRAVYAATKAYINTFSEILQNELDGTGVKVQALCPGIVRTEFQERVGMDISRLPAEMIMTAEAVVEASLAGLRLDEVICVPALDDPGLLAQIQESRGRLLEHSGGNTPAKRYTISEA